MPSMDLDSDTSNDHAIAKALEEALPDDMDAEDSHERTASEVGTVKAHPQGEAEQATTSGEESRQTDENESSAVKFDRDRDVEKVPMDGDCLFYS